MTIASIDIGTNTILMVIAEYDINTGKLKTLLNEHQIPRIGKGLTPGSPISDDKALLLLEILRDYKRIADSCNCDKIIATATNAFRIASNRDELLNRIKVETGIDVNVVTGEEESFLSYLGATIDADSDEPVLVIDIGGGSTEIITGKGDKILFRKSFHTGVVSSTEYYFKNDPPAMEDIVSFNANLQNIFEELNDRNFIISRTIAIAGTPTTLACIKQSLYEYDEDLIEGSKLIKTEIGAIISELTHLSSSQIKKKYKAVVSGREDVLLAGSLILFHLMNILKIDEVIVSTKGIRYGAIVLNQMSG
ncbi:MAG: hypothetical protein R6W90_12855 [Ignavibacteriaceae bacterium]